MRTKRIKNSRFYSRLVILRRFLRTMGVKPVHVILPIIFYFIAATFEGISLSLLVPLVKGIASNNFKFVNETPILRNLICVLPSEVRTLSSGLSHNKSIFLFLVGCILLAVILKNALSYTGSLISAYWRVKFKNNIYRFILNRFMSFGKLFFDRTSQGYLNLIMNYSELAMNVLNVFEKTVENFFNLTIYFVVMSMISWKLTIVTLFLFPVLHFVLKFIIRKLEEVATLKNVIRIDLSRRVFNMLSCIPLIKAYSKEEETKEVYAGINEELRKLEFREAKIINLATPLQELIVTTSLLIMISIVALLLARDKPAEISVFVVFFYAARRSLPLFSIFNDIKIAFAQARPPIKEISKVFDDTDKFFVADGKKIFEGLKKGIEFNHLNFSYFKEMQVLKDISFFIESGRTTAIVGPTGAGKTTLISLLLRFYDCPPASILIDGVDIREFNLKSLRGHIALVSQEVFLLNDTLRNNIAFGLDAQIGTAQLMDVAKKARLYDFIMQLPSGLDTEIGDRGVKLSGGERQRVAIARSLLKGSEIFIMDEATSSLDSKTEKLIQEAIDEAMHGRTAIVIAHRFSTIKNADKIVVIENGRFVEGGALNELLAKKGKFYQYWEAQKFY